MEVMSNMPHEMQRSMPQPMPQMTMTTMMPTPEIPIPAGAVLRLAHGGRHVMLMGVQRHFQRGDSTSAELTFKHTGTVQVPVLVIDYTQIDMLVR
jgi:copper(I)-binding protein